MTLGGHVHRVCWASIRPDDPGKMVTSSLDSSLKIWDLAACMAGSVPAVGGLHYIVLRASGDRKYLATNQGWGSSCQLTDVATRKVVATSTAGHGGFVDNATFTVDSTRLITIDTGHRGQYTVCHHHSSRTHVDSYNRTTSYQNQLVPMK